MFDLPLFPLNTVLFPGQPLSLHVFEDRYKEMIGMCIETQQPFGVVLLESGKAEMNPFNAEPIKPHMIGCTAQITQVQHLFAGRMNITAVGHERFMIHELKHEHAYLVGGVELYPMTAGDNTALLGQSAALTYWIERYLKALEKAGQIQPGNRVLPTQSDTLAYLAAVLLQGATMEQKQALLSAPSLLDMTHALRDAYRREVMLLEMLLKPPSQELPGPFSLN